MPPTFLLFLAAFMLVGMFPVAIAAIVACLIIPGASRLGQRMAIFGTSGASIGFALVLAASLFTSSMSWIERAGICAAGFTAGALIAVAFTIAARARGKLPTLMTASHASIPTVPCRRKIAALIFGTAGLTALYLACIVLEPTLVEWNSPSDVTGMSASIPGWADSNVWLAAFFACCLALAAVSFITQWISPADSRLAARVLLAIVLVYDFMAQFPSTRSTWRISLWAFALPASLLLGSWLSTRTKAADRASPPAVR